MDDIYREMPLDEIPWNVSSPPELLVNAVESGRLEPCWLVELGCGAGNYAVWLAEKGFDVTGIDISAEAIKYARRLAHDTGVTCNFVVADLLGDLKEIDTTFEFAFDWELLHHIFPDNRPPYVHNVYRLLRPGAEYLSVCFSENDPAFGGAGKFRKTSIGTTLYFSSETELRELFTPYFEIVELQTQRITGKRSPHQAVVAWLRRK